MPRSHHIMDCESDNQFLSAHVSVIAAFTHGVTIITWILSVVVSVCFHNKIWELNRTHPSLFTLDYILGDVFWASLFAFQLGHIVYDVCKSSPMALGMIRVQFIVNNVFHFAFVILFLNSLFILAEVALALNLINLCVLYFNHPICWRIIHAAVISGPLSWTVVAMYWDGALMFPDPTSTPCQIAGQISVWGILATGAFFAWEYQDYTMTCYLFLLSAALGVAQWNIQVVPLQWIFSVVLASSLYVVTVILIFRAWLNQRMQLKRVVAEEHQRSLKTDKSNSCGA